MKINDLFQETFAALLVNKARSGLTVLGIVIGIGSVIGMISIGQGAQQTIQSNIESLGSNLLMISPGAQRGVGMQVSAGRGSAQTLTLADAEAVQNEISSVGNIAPELSGRYQITAKGANTNTSVSGTTPAYPLVRNVEIEDGYFISEQQVRSMSKVAVLGPTARNDLFGEGVNPIGQTIRIKKIDFKIIGVTKTKGGGGFGSQDDMIYVPITTAQQFLAGGDYVSSISVQVASEDLMTQTQEEINSLLLARHNITDPTLTDFNILNQEDIVSAASSITQTFTILLAAIAGISLVVGGIGIMNMMLTTVTERTREIGLRKALGAKKMDINLQFLVESIMLTFIGGVFGIVLGWAISLLITQFGGINTTVSLYSVFLAFGVSAAIGVIFGYYPARRAAALNPIEALRYE